MNETGTEAPSQPPSSSFPWRTFALYGLALLFFAIVLWRSEIWNADDALDDVRLEIVALVPLLSLAIAVPIAIREREVLLALGRRFSAWALAPISYYGNTVGYMTPAASGELLRPSLFERVFGLPVAQGAGLVLYERLFSFLLFGLSCVFALAWTDIVPLWVGLASLPVLFATIFLTGTIVSQLPSIAKAFRLDSLRRFVPGFVERRLGGGLRESGETMGQLWRDRALTPKFAVLTYATFTIAAVQFWLLLEGVGTSLSLQEAWVVLGVGAIAGMLSGLPLGLGATDAVMVSLLRAYDVDVTTAGTVVVLTRLSINLPTGILGSIAYVTTLRQQSRTDGSSTPRGRSLAAVGDR